MWATDECRKEGGASISTHSIQAQPTYTVLVALSVLVVWPVLVVLAVGQIVSVVLVSLYERPQAPG